MIPELLPYHSYDPDGQVFVQVDGSLGLAWDLKPIESETLSEDALGRLSRRIESLLALFPEGSTAQFIVSRTPHVSLEGWLEATTQDGILRDLAVSRVRATQTFGMTHEGVPFSACTLSITMTLRIFPVWKAPTIREGLRSALAGARTIEEKFRQAYTREKGILQERAAAIENLLTQAGVPFRRLALEALRAILYSALNPGRTTPPPVDDGAALPP